MRKLHWCALCCEGFTDYREEEEKKTRKGGEKRERLKCFWEKGGNIPLIKGETTRKRGQDRCYWKRRRESVG